MEFAYAKHRIVLIVIWLIALYFLFKPGDVGPMAFPYSDKVGHFGLFFTLAWVTAANFPKKSYMIILLGLIAWGVGSEYLQELIAINRRNEFLDMVADGLGAAFSLMVKWGVDCLKSGGASNKPLSS